MDFWFRLLFFLSFFLRVSFDLGHVLSKWRQGYIEFLLKNSFLKYMWFFSFVSLFTLLNLYMFSCRTKDDKWRCLKKCGSTFSSSFLPFRIRIYPSPYQQIYSWYSLLCVSKEILPICGTALQWTLEFAPWSDQTHRCNLSYQYIIAEPS